MSVFAVVLLAAAVALLAAAEWPRLGGRLHVRARRNPRAHLRAVPDESDETDDFARSVERDLAALPTIDDPDLKRRR
ncbi:MAG TPA: hypothetical protein VGH52_07215 [Gaiellaceae bacterium]